MPEYWLTPVISVSPVTLGAERIMIRGQEAERFRGMLSGIHPRLLLSFKSVLLLSGDEDRCGSAEEETAIRFGDPGPIEFGGTFTLSHCGESLIDRLPSPKEALEWSAAATGPLCDEKPYVSWLAIMIRWWSSGYRVMLLKEE